MFAEKSKRLMVVNSGHPVSTRLICFPPTGVDPEPFRGWPEGLADHIELVTLRLPGHGSRSRETPYEQWAPLLDDTFAALQPYLAAPHALYGHGIGGRMAYELARLTQSQYPDLTRHVFISGCPSPDSQPPEVYLHTLPTDDFIRALVQLGIAPESMLHDKKAMRLFEPAMRSHLKLSELWPHRCDTGLNIPLTALYGSEDPLATADSMMNWRQFTCREFELIEVSGNHGFPEAQRSRLLHIINTHLGLLGN